MLILEDVQPWVEHSPPSLALELDEEGDCAIPYPTRVMTFRQATAGEGHHAGSCI